MGKSMVTITGLTDLEGLAQAFKKMSLEIEAKVEKTTFRHGQAIRTSAIMKAPAGGTGLLRQRIEIDTLFGGSKYRVVIGPTVDYGRMVEEGTGPRSKMPPLRPMKLWAKRKGIPASALYPIRRSIMRKGTKAQPYLIPSYNKIAPLYVRNLKTILKHAKI